MRPSKLTGFFALLAIFAVTALFCRPLPSQQLNSNFDRDPAQPIDQYVDTWPFVAVRQPLDHLFEILFPHGDVKPLEYTLATIAKVELGAAHGVTAIGQESHRLIRGDAFLREKRQHTIDGRVLECMNVREAVSASHNYRTLLFPSV